MNFKKEKIDLLFVLDSFIFILVLIGSFFYTVKRSDFAEISIQLPFLTFPIFIGEILLGVCLMLLLIKWIMSPPQFKSVQIFLFGFYVIWILGRALPGYFSYGPYALRNAALFYYPFFALIGYCVHRKEFFNQVTIILLLLSIILTGILKSYFGYFVMAYYLVYWILVFNLENKWLRYSAMALFFVLFPLNILFIDGRAFAVGAFIAILYLIFMFFFVFSHFSLKQKTAGALLLIFIFSLFCFKSLGEKKLRSIAALNTLLEEFKQSDVIVQRNKKVFVRREIPVQLYNQNIRKDQEMIRQTVVRNIDEYMDRQLSVMNAGMTNPPEINRKVASADPVKKESMAAENKSVVIEQAVDAFQEISKNALEEHKGLMLQESQKWLTAPPARSVFVERITAVSEAQEQKLYQEKERILNEMKQSHKLSRMESNVLEARVDETAEKISRGFDAQGQVILNNVNLGGDRGLATDHGNTLFRLFIWRDMLEELSQDHNWVWGINWGLPLRPISIEILLTARGEWERDGWITPHNSFLHLLYRGGIVGMAIIVMIFAGLIYMIIQFVRLKSLTGILLTGGFIYWLTIMNFLVFL